MDSLITKYGILVERRFRIYSWENRTVVFFKGYLFYLNQYQNLNLVKIENFLFHQKNGRRIFFNNFFFKYDIGSSKIIFKWIHKQSYIWVKPLDQNKSNGKLFTIIFILFIILFITLYRKYDQKWKSGSKLKFDFFNS